MKKRLLELLKDKKSGKLLFFAGIIGILLIYISTLSSKNDTQTAENLTSQVNFSVNEYRDYLEKEIKEIVTAISGDTAAVVTITIDSEVTYVYADEKSENNETASNNTVLITEQTYITVTDSEGGEQPVIVTAYMPKVRGVAIVCRAQNSEVIENIEGAVMAALDITSRKIFISDKKGE